MIVGNFSHTLNFLHLRPSSELERFFRVLYWRRKRFGEIITVPGGEMDVVSIMLDVTCPDTSAKRYKHSPTDGPGVIASYAQVK